MKYDSSRAFEKHLEGAAPRHFSPIYSVVGKDAFECREAVDLLLRFLLSSEKNREMALSTFEGPQLEERSLKEALDSYSFFVKTRVLWISQADKLKKEAYEILEKYLSQPPLNQYIVLSASAWQKNSSFYKTLEKKGVILEFAELKPWERERYLVEWVNKRIVANRRLIDYQACQFLVRQVGGDCSLLAQEIDKLLCYCGDKEEIGLQDVKSVCLQQPIESVWELGEAIFSRNPAKALAIGRGLLMSGQALLPLLRQIRSQFQTDYQVSLLLARGKQAQEITQEFPYMKGNILQRHISQAQQYGPESFKKGLLAIDFAEARLKTVSIQEPLALELLILKLTQ